MDRLGWLQASHDAEHSPIEGNGVVRIEGSIEC